MTDDGISVIAYGPSKGGKALSLDTPLPTPTGWTTMGAVRVGDELFNDQGQITKVVGIGPVWTDRPCRRVIVPGDEIVADAGHIWRASRPKGDNLGTYTLVETDELQVSPTTYRALPWTPELQIEEVELPVHPYILGVWIGDGDAFGGSQMGFCTERKLVALERCVTLYESGVVRQRAPGEYEAFLPGLRTKLNEIGAREVVSEGKAVKHIPLAYLRAGTEQRRELLAGLIDTDAHVTKKTVDYTTTVKEIADAVAELACSLGIRAHVNGPYPSAYTKGGKRFPAQDHYDVHLRGVVRSHRITHRHDWGQIIPESRHKQYYRLHIKSLDKVPSVPVRCIQVDDLHGMYLAGKSMIPTHNSTLGDTTPAPRLVLDAEMGSRFTPSKKTTWDPAREAPPEPDGSWDTVLVPVHTYSSVLKAYEWLNSGRHPFRSVVVDSISEVQQRLADSLVGTNPMQLQDWGTMLRQASDLVRKFRDLTTHPVKPLDCVLFIAMAHQRQDGTWHPHVQGQLKTTLPYYTDLLAYLAALPQEDGSVIRRLLIGPTQGYETGERVGGKLGRFIDNPNISDMLQLVRGEVLGAEGAEVLT